MIELSTQQEERLNALMVSGGFQSVNELFNTMLADFEYQQQMRQLRKEIKKGMEGESIVVKDRRQYLLNVMERAKNGRIYD